MRRQERTDGGFALLAALMVMMLLSALLVGFLATVAADIQTGNVDRDQTQAYAGAHAGLEKLTADLGNLFAANASPTAADINAVLASPPAIPGITYLAPDGTPGYSVVFTPNAQGNPSPADPNGTQITAGPYQGFLGIITPYDLTVTARTQGGAEVRLRRSMQTIAVPVFQFGLFSENDLSFFAGPNFNFGGRVHTNANLFLASGDGSTLTLADRVTAVGEIIRTHLSNGWATNTAYQGNVRPIRAPGVFRNLARTEGSLVNSLGSAENEPTWTNLSIGTYNSNIRNGRTGARRLDLPLVSQGALPIDLIRRPPLGIDEQAANPQVFEQRYFGMVSLRILLSDTPAAIQNLPTVTATPPVLLGNLAVNPVAGYAPGGLVAPFAVSSGNAGQGYRSSAAEPLLGGYIKIEMQNQAGAWTDVTLEILNLGITGRNLSTGVLNTPSGAVNPCPNEPNPDAIIRLQRVRDVVASAGYIPCGVNGAGTVISPTATDFWPNALYDTREGNFRDNLAAGSLNMALGGVIHYVELDVNNLRRWFLGQIGATGTNARNDNGFTVYFSDRRNNQNPAVPMLETGEYGFEDVINPGDTNGIPNGVLDPGEDVNGNTVLDVYGQNPVNLPAGAAAPLDANARPWTIVTDPSILRINRPLLFRRALKLVNGGLGNIIAPGLTVASENPVYVQGNYNAASNDTLAAPSVACSILADAVSVLSNAWNDIRSFIGPNNVNGGAPRTAATTGYRTAIVAGKHLSFDRPTWGADQDFGTDGGAHNFLRFAERWSGQTLNYRGSITSFYTSRQAVGTYKCCSNVYGPPTRAFFFDANFLNPFLLPPRTPMFRDVNTLTFRQILRPNQ
jgi:hypothetical protein